MDEILRHCHKLNATEIENLIDYLKNELLIEKKYEKQHYIIVSAQNDLFKKWHTICDSASNSKNENEMFHNFCEAHNQLTRADKWVNIGKVVRQCDQPCSSYLCQRDESIDYDGCVYVYLLDTCFQCCESCFTENYFLSGIEDGAHVDFGLLYIQFKKFLDQKIKN